VKCELQRWSLAQTVNLLTFSKALGRFGMGITRVRRDVFPEPLGPIKRIEGKVVRPLARKTTVWRKTGIDRTRRIAIARPNGEGLRKACAHSLAVDIFRCVCRSRRSTSSLKIVKMQGFGT